MRRYPFLGIALLMSMLTVACGKLETTAEASGTPAVPVTLQTLKTSTLQDSTEFVGTLEAEQVIELKPQIQGQIQQILVKPGDRVNPGDVLFVLTPDQTVPQYNSAEATVNAEVAKRDAAAKQLQVSRSALASAQSQYELARVNNQRYQYLANQGAVQQMQADQFATDLQVQANAVKQARDQVAADAANLKAAESSVQQAQAQAASDRVNVNFKQVAAPISGSVGNITLKVGDYVNTGDALTTINQNDYFDLQIPVPINRSAALHKGLPVQLLDPTTRQLISSGSIYFVSSTTNADSQAILTRARFANARGKLRDAQYVKARVIWDMQPGVLVPVDAVTTIGGQSFVFVSQAQTVDGKSQAIARQVPVTLGNIQGQDYQVISGLKPGEKIIVSGVVKLRDGALIAARSN